MPARSFWSRPLGLLLCVMLPCTSYTMEIRRVQTCSGVVLRLRGDVREGDYLRLKSQLRGKHPILGLDLSSDGGDFEEGLRIANLAHRENLSVYVSDECDSACADIFFSARRRFVGANSKIGVHSISNDRDVEDSEARLLTVKLARLWARRGVPGSAIGKMVMTRPSEISYLDHADLSALEASTGNPFASEANVAGQPQPHVCATQLQASNGAGRKRTAR
jgi:hypothetical protein